MKRKMRMLNKIIVMFMLVCMLTGCGEKTIKITKDVKESFNYYTDQEDRYAAIIDGYGEVVDIDYVTIYPSHGAVDIWDHNHNVITTDISKVILMSKGSYEIYKEANEE